MWGGGGGRKEHWVQSRERGVNKLRGEEKGKGKGGWGRGTEVIKQI